MAKEYKRVLTRSCDHCKAVIEGDNVRTLREQVTVEGRKVGIEIKVLAADGSRATDDVCLGCVVQAAHEITGKQAGFPPATEKEVAAAAAAGAEAKPVDQKVDEGNTDDVDELQLDLGPRDDEAADAANNLGAPPVIE